MLDLNARKMLGSPATGGITRAAAVKTNKPLSAAALASLTQPIAPGWSPIVIAGVVRIAGDERASGIGQVNGRRRAIRVGEDERLHRVVPFVQLRDQRGEEARPDR